MLIFAYCVDRTGCEGAGAGGSNAADVQAAAAHAALHSELRLLHDVRGESHALMCYA